LTCAAHKWDTYCVNKKEVKKKSKLPNSLTTVTPFSKFLAMILFILLPFFGFYLGMLYQQYKTANYVAKNEILQSSRNGESNKVTPPDMGEWKNYSNREIGFKVKYPRSISPTVADYGETIVFSNDNKSGKDKVSLSISASSLKGKTLQQISTPSNVPMLGKIVKGTNSIKIGDLEGYTYTARIQNENVNYDNTYIFLPKGDADYILITSQGEADKGLSTLENEILQSLTIL
jgi:hypothetical protein